MELNSGAGSAMHSALNALSAYGNTPPRVHYEYSGDGLPTQSSLKRDAVTQITSLLRRDWFVALQKADLDEVSGFTSLGL